MADDPSVTALYDQVMSFVRDAYPGMTVAEQEAWLRAYYEYLEEKEDK